MKKKQLVLGLVTVSIAYLIGAYFMCHKLIASLITEREEFTVIGLVVSGLGLFVLLSVYLFFTLRRQLQEKNELSCGEKLHKANEGALKALISALDYRDHATWEHSTRVVAYATAIAEKIGLDQAEQEKLALAGFLHDIGKIGVPDRILLKKTKLLPEEWEAIKRHPELGYDIIHQIGFLHNAADIILLHHERYDGSGYPLGLKGEQIPLMARIFAVADALDAMTSERPYRAARTMKEAVGEVCSLSGIQFCPKCVETLEDLGIERLYQIQQYVKNQETMKFRPEDLVRCS